jgi:Ran GTPase-activating protein (RanGAP) involved in mRNA processing and transport
MRLEECIEMIRTQLVPRIAFYSTPREHVSLILDELASSTTLRGIVIIYRRRYPKHLAIIAQVLEKNNLLTSFMMYGNCFNHHAMTDFANGVRRSPSLTALNLTSCDLKEVSAQAMAELFSVDSKLLSITFNSNKLGNQCVQLCAKALSRNTSLTSLNLADSGLSLEGAQALAQALQLNTTLTKLVLRSNHLKDDGVEAIAVALRVNTSLTELNLKNVFFEDQGPQELSKALLVNTTLTSLNLAKNYFSNRGGQALEEALVVNTTLRVLNLESNRFLSSKDALLRALVVNTTLTSVNIGGIGILEENVPELAEVLRVNSTLTELHLANNSLCQEAAVLAEAMTRNVTLKSINLHNCRIEINGMLGLARMLRTNTTLTCLGLSGNALSERSVTAIVDALSQNSSLRSLDLSFCNLNTRSVQALAISLRGNTVLSSLILKGNYTVGEAGIGDLALTLRHNIFLMELNLLDTLSHANRTKEFFDQYLYRNNYRKLVLASPHGLKNMILYSLFAKPVEIKRLQRTIPWIIKLQLTECALSLKPLSDVLLSQAVLSGWCFSSLEEGLRKDACEAQYSGVSHK